MTFRNKIVMITGPGGHLGQALTMAFSRREARLILVDRNIDVLKASCGQISESAFVAADLLDLPQAYAALADAEKRFGRVDVLCHLAGAFRAGEAVHETTERTWDFLFDINARTLVNIARYVVPRMIAHCSGKIVSVGAFAAQKGIERMGAYCAAKASVIRLTEACLSS